MTSPTDTNVAIVQALGLDPDGALAAELARYRLVSIDDTEPT